jgi:hypothetical protein
MRRLILFVLGLAAALVLVPTTAVADSATHSYVLVMEEANFGVAPNGDQIAIEGEAEFSVNPKAAEGGGSFTHRNAAGTVLATGTWKSRSSARRLRICRSKEAASMRRSPSSWSTSWTIRSQGSARWRG